MNEQELRERIAEELLKIPKGYVGINDPIPLEQRERQLKRTRVQAESILALIKQAGWLPVEEVKLEVLTDGEIIAVGGTPFFDIDVSRSTITKNEAKGKLYRKVE
jgi:hypothetical protein